MMMMHEPPQLQPPTLPPLPPPQPHYIKHFCPHLQIDAIGILRRNGQYFFYWFDYINREFQPLECLGCQATVTERHLYPLYAEYCKDLENFVIFAFNNLTLKVEQFVFHQSTGGFEEVYRPEMMHDINKPLPDILCVVKGSQDYGMVIIQRDHYQQNFKKSRAFEDQYLTLPPILVKTLMMKKLESFQLIPSDVDTFRAPTFPDAQKTAGMIFQYCPRYHGIDLVCVRQRDQSYIRFYFSEQSGEFYQVTCPECTGPITENGLRPFYAAYSKAVQNHVIFMENRQNFKIEQYVFCKRTLGFRQVEAKDVVFDERLIQPGPEILTVPTTRGTFYLTRNQNGFMEKYMCYEIGRTEKIMPREVKTFEVQEKERLEERKFEPLYIQTSEGLLMAARTEKKYPGGALMIRRLQEAMGHLDLNKQPMQPAAPRFPYGYIKPENLVFSSESEDSEDEEEEEEESDSETSVENGSNDANNGSIDQMESEDSKSTEDSDSDNDSDLEGYDTCGDEDLDEA